VTGSHISLFSGVGMTDLAAEQLGFKTIATAEIDPFNRRVIAKRFPNAVHHDDVRKVTATGGSPNPCADLNLLVRRPLLVSGGFPCQDVSDAGMKAGLDGARSGLWTEMLRVIKEFQPDYVLAENVAALRSRGLDRVLNDLHHAGYDVQWECIPAGAVGAPHLRDRIWIGAVKRGAQARKSWATGDKQIGYVQGPGRGVLHKAEAVTKLPRAGSMVGGLVFQRETRYTIKTAKVRMQAEPLPSYPTPSVQDGKSGPGTSPKRTGGKNLRTHIRDIDGDHKLNPTWLEWMMGVPEGWTNPDLANADLVEHNGWTVEPMPRVDGKAPHRIPRVVALGNGLVPQVAAVALRSLLEW
jgi:DNA (cytosine-5)-methyltransferase 1